MHGQDRLAEGKCMTEQSLLECSIASGSRASNLGLYFAEQADEAMRSGEADLADHLIGLAYRALDGHFGSVVVPFSPPKRAPKAASTVLANTSMVAQSVEPTRGDSSVA